MTEWIVIKFQHPLLAAYLLIIKSLTNTDRFDETNFCWNTFICLHDKERIAYSFQRSWWEREGRQHGRRRCSVPAAPRHSQVVAARSACHQAHPGSSFGIEWAGMAAAFWGTEWDSARTYRPSLFSPPSSAELRTGGLKRVGQRRHPRDPGGPPRTRSHLKTLICKHGFKMSKFAELTKDLPKFYRC